MARPKGSKNKSGRANYFHSDKERKIFDILKEDFLDNNLDLSFGLCIKCQVKKYWDIDERLDGKHEYETYEKKQRRLIGNFRSFVENCNPEEFFYDWNPEYRMFFDAVEYCKKHPHCKNYRILAELDHYWLSLRHRNSQITGRIKEYNKRAFQGNKIYQHQLTKGSKKISLPSLVEREEE